MKRKRNKDLYRMGEIELGVEIYHLLTRLKEAKQLFKKRKAGYVPPENKPNKPEDEK